MSSVVDESIIRFTGGSPNKVINVNLDDEKLEVLRALGASTHAQLISKRIVYVEGESDERLLTLFEPKLVHEATFIVTEGGATTPRVMDLLNKATRYENFRAIIDRDHHSDPEIKRLEENSGEYLHVWKKRHIENYLLDQETIY